MRRHIQRGLHCLTGRRGSGETKSRLSIADQYNPTSSYDHLVAFGLAVHALGDSYAHRRGSETDAAMHDGPFGHASLSIDLGEEKDVICKRTAWAYNQYTADLFKAMTGAAKRAGLTARAEIGKGSLIFGL